MKSSSLLSGFACSVILQLFLISASAAATNGDTSAGTSTHGKNSTGKKWFRTENRLVRTDSAERNSSIVTKPEMPEAGSQSGEITFAVDSRASIAEELLAKETVAKRKKRLSSRFSLDYDSVKMAERLENENLVRFWDGCCDFASTMISAFEGHRPVIITPDAVWMMILQGLSNHINKTPEKFRDLFVNHSGKEEIMLVNEDFNATGHICDLFCQEVETRIKDKKLVELLNKPFSTSEDDDITAFHMCIMSVVKEYFKFSCIESGIPSITLRGTAEDWKDLRERAGHLKKYDLKWWIDALDPVLAKFVETACSGPSGSVDKDFWLGMVKVYCGGSSSVPDLNGWIINFYPYIGDRKNSHFVKGDLSQATTYKETYEANALAYTISTVPVFVKGTLAEEEHVFAAGIINALQHEDTKALQPIVGWVRGRKKVL